MTASGLPDRIEMFIAAVDRSTDLARLFDILAAEVQHLGFEFFSYWVLSAPGDGAQPFCITNYPYPWSKYYLDENLRDHDHVVRLASRALRPFIWSESLRGAVLTQRQQDVFDLAGEAGLVSGGSVPIHGPGLVTATLSVAGDEKEEIFAGRFIRSRHELQLIATYVHEKVMAMNLLAAGAAGVDLTAREKEILVWVARGKSRWEVSMILSISEDTVKTHLEKVRLKLKAANTTQAIAKALLNGLISP